MAIKTTYSVTFLALNPTVVNIVTAEQSYMQVTSAQGKNVATHLLPIQAALCIWVWLCIAVLDTQRAQMVWST